MLHEETSKTQQSRKRRGWALRLIVPAGLAAAVLALLSVVSLANAANFVHIATAANTRGDHTDIDNPVINGRPLSTRLLVTPTLSPNGTAAVVDNHPVGVWYNGSTQKWSIFNEDKASMPVGAAFNVRIQDTAATNTPIQTAQQTNARSNSTYITNALTDGNPNAIVMITPNWNPDGVGGTYSNHNTGVWYNGKQWAIYNEDRLTMPVDASFNTELFSAAGDGVFVHTATSSNTPNVLPSFGQVYTIIDNPMTNGNPRAILFVTHNWNPTGKAGLYVDSPLAVNYLSAEQKWAIVATSSSETASPMPIGAAFNVLVTSGEVAVRYYEGESATGSLQEALDKALQQLDKDLPEGGIFDAMAQWTIVAITGWQGGIAGFNTVRVKISATRSPSW